MHKRECGVRFRISKSVFFGGAAVNENRRQAKKLAALLSQSMAPQIADV